MFSRLGELISAQWPATILVWFALVAGLKLLAPAWDEVTRDGDLAFLPPQMPSVVGERLMAEAFPANRAKSQIVVVFARATGPLTAADLAVADRFASRYHNHLAAQRLQQPLADSAGGTDDSDRAWDEAAAHLEAALLTDPENPLAWQNRGSLHQLRGRPDEARADRERAAELDPALRSAPSVPLLRIDRQLPLIDVWTRHHEVFGPKLRSADRHALLVVLQLSNEFMATDNMQVLEFVKHDVSEFRQQADGGLTLGISGSAAVGGDMLQAAAESIRNTELFTITMVLVILLLVYRAPVLAVVPLITIGAALATSVSLLSLLAAWADASSTDWFDFKIFKTTKIFIVVILFGAGTDFCLFLIARYRECLEQQVPRPVAIRSALVGVGDALTASALTTVVGLGMMFFAEFGKFRNSGPAIGLCLIVTLLACLTLAPALLQAFGASVFWPFGVQTRPKGVRGLGRSYLVWNWIGRQIVVRPASILLVCSLTLLPLAWRGVWAADHVTFDLVSELDHARPSYQGGELLKEYFPVGESGPIIVLANKLGAGFNSPDRRQAILAKAAIFDLTEALYGIDGVRAVRSLAEPLGDKPQWSLTSGKLFLQEHRLTEAIFLGQAPQHRGNVTRFEVILDHDPFSRPAMVTLRRVDRFLQQQAQAGQGFWSGASFSYAGTTAGIRDLRDVTRSDRWRIQVLVTLAVLAVLLLILRQPMICLYLIASVLFSYLVTIGATELFFAGLYGDSYQGLDWKVPIFLFVILVAVGEDYNIYLVTRVLEEQAVHGPFDGLRRAIAATGGIITSCGVIMVGTFISMTSGTLRGIVELGFALALGIALDTFVVRPILVPAFLALRSRWQAGRWRG